MEEFVHRIEVLPVLRIGDVSLSVLKLGAGILILLVGFVLAGIIGRALERALGRRGAGLGTRLAAERWVGYGLRILSVFLALQATGVNLAGLFAASAVFAVGIGIAMQKIAENFVSGLILLVERSITVGDVLEVEGRMVRVEEMGIRATIVRTLDEERLIVPNGMLVQQAIKNLTLRDSLYRIHVKVGVAYGSDLDAVRRVLEDVGNKASTRSEAHDALVLLLGFGDSSIEYELCVWLNDPWIHRRAASEVRENIWRAFAAEKIVIAFPQIDVHFDPPLQRALAAFAPQPVAKASLGGGA